MLSKERDFLRQRVAHSKEALGLVDKQLEMAAAIQSGSVADSTKKCVAAHASGISLLQTEFSYNPIYRRPGDSFKAYSSFVPRVKLP